MTAYQCSRCKVQLESKSGRLPLGWKRRGEATTCKKCWRSQYVARAITIPIWQVPEGFRDALAEQWREATRLANWVHTQRYLRDVRRQPGVEKMPPMPPAYLYPEARAGFPLLQPAVTVAIDHAETGKYRATRYEVVWTSGRSLANVRYPYPLPVPGDSIRLSEVDGRFYAAMRFGTAAEGTSWQVALAGGRDYQRQLAALKKIASGDLELIEASIYRIESHASDGRSAGSEHGTLLRTMLKIVAWFPVSERAEKERFFSIRTGTDEFLYGVIQDREEPWVVNADHVRDWCHQHIRNLRRLAQDQKADGWRPKRRKRIAKGTLGDRCEKHNARVDSFIKSTVASAVHAARRMGVTKIKYDDAQRDYLPKFAWDRLRQQFRNKCEESGIEFELASSEVAKEKPRTARKSHKDLSSAS